MCAARTTTMPAPSAFRIVDHILAAALMFAMILCAHSQLGASASHSYVVSQQSVFSAGEGGYSCFRIPSMVAINATTIVAFAEGRGLRKKGSCADHGDVMIVAKTSVDGGGTWSSLRVIRDEFPSATSIGNPCPILDTTTGVLFLLYNRDNVDGFVMHSTDNGDTWSSPSNITSSTKHSGFFGFGPPGGIQLASGRLVAGAYSDGSYAVYSDDHGVTWKHGSIVDVPGVGECQVAAVRSSQSATDEQLLLFMRDSNGHRYIARSATSGTTWNSTAEVSSLTPTTACEASIASYSVSQVPQSKLRIQPQAHSTVAAESGLVASLPHSSSRTNMTIFTSLDGGYNWSGKEVLWHGPSAYSSLVVLENSAARCSGAFVLCLYERGSLSPYEELTLATMCMS